MITVVCSIGNKKIFDLRLGASLKGHEGEYILIKAPINLTLPQAYNSIRKREIKTKYVMFVHEDVFFYDKDWIKKVEEYCDKCKGLGVAGVAGVKIGGGPPNNVGYVDHWGSRGIPRKRGWGHHKYDGKIVSVQTVDSLCFVVPTKILKKYKFNIEFPFHMMTEDYCLTLKYIHNLKVYVIPLKVWHNEAGLKRHVGSGGMVNLKKWHKKLHMKWRKKLLGIGIYCTSVSYGMERDLFRVKYCPHCGGDIQETPKGFICRVCGRKY